MSNLIRVLIVDDHMVVRQGLSSLIIPRNGMEVVGEASDGLEAVKMARKLKPDIILMDLIMPKMNGIEAIREIRKEDSQARILVLTSFSEDKQVATAIQAGALGYLLKDSNADELFHAIRSVYSGNLSLSQELATKLMTTLQQPTQPPPPEPLLTSREIDVLKGIARGLSNREIADLLVVSTTTVRSHVSNLLSKLNLTNRTQAALYAVERGLLEDDPN